MTAPASRLHALLRTLHPVRNEGTYAFACLPSDFDARALDPVATIREREGLTVIVAEEVARKAGIEVLYRAAWITLTVHSDLQAIGLTAAFASALGQAGISCNVVAGAHHDHLFVPVESGEQAMVVLGELQSSATSEPQRCQ